LGLSKPTKRIGGPPTIQSSHTAETGAPVEKCGKKRTISIAPGAGTAGTAKAKLAPELAERLGGKVSEELALFASRMKEGLLAASVAIGLEVMGELMEADWPKSPASKASTTPPERLTGMGQRKAR